MSDATEVIKPERVGLWAAAAMIVALLAFALAIVGLFRIQATGLAVQTQTLMLNKKIEDMKKAAATPVAPAAAVQNGVAK